MATITLPAPVPPLPEWTFKPTADELTADLRTAATATSAVAEWALANRTPPGWQGDDADAAGRAAGKIAASTDAATAALERVTRACEIYVSAMVDLGSARDDLESRRTRLNEDIAELEHHGSVPADDEGAVEQLTDQAHALAQKAAALTGDIERWSRLVASVEERLVRAFQSLDSSAEAAAAALARGNVDTQALLDTLAGKKSPAAVAAWWDSLSQAERDALLHEQPGLIGNTNGIPTIARDDANRRSLAEDLAQLHALEAAGDLSPAEAQQLKSAESAEKALAHTTTDAGDHVETYLLAYDPDAFGSDGAVAVAYGNPDTATNTAVLVPGTTHDGSKIDSQGEDALHVYGEAAKSGESVAAIAWMGYDAPSKTGEDGTADIAGVALEDKAEEGGHLLSDFVNGLRATDTGEQSHLTVIGHSYGATTVAHGATDGMNADRLVLLGSPGAGGGSDQVGDLNMPKDSVYVGAAENDPITWLGRLESDPLPGSGLPLIGDDLQEKLQNLGLGQDPAQADFGANRFYVAPGDELDIPNLDFNNLSKDDFTPVLDTAMQNHGSYYSGDSLHSIGTIVSGGDPATIDGRDTPANDRLTDFLEEQVKQEAQDEFHNRVVAPLEKGYQKYVDDPIIDPLVGAGRDVASGAKQVVTDPVGTFNDAFDGALGLLH
jgi:hypothetical protein